LSIPQVATTLGNLGIVQRELGELAAARTTQERALAIGEAAYGPDHPDVGKARAAWRTISPRIRRPRKPKR
jgi:tetratricopeptide repeat protein